jgi:hypothetical protein
VSDMRRREFITLLGGAAAAWPIAAQAQQARTPVVGFLGSAAEADYKTTTAAIRRSLHEAGYVETQNLLIDYRWADFRYDRLPAARSGAGQTSGRCNLRDRQRSIHASAHVIYTMLAQQALDPFVDL